MITAAEVHLNKVQLIQNQALRVVTNSPQYTSINDLHDITGSLQIKTHLIQNAKHRIQIMRKNSPIVSNVIQEHNMLRHIQENALPLDIIANYR